MARVCQRHEMPADSFLCPFRKGLERVAVALRVAEWREDADVRCQTVVREARHLVDQVEHWLAVDAGEQPVGAVDKIEPRLTRVHELVETIRPDFKVEQHSKIVIRALTQQRRPAVADAVEEVVILRQTLDVDLVAVSREVSSDWQNSDDVAEPLRVGDADFHREKTIVRMFFILLSLVRILSSGCPQ